MNKAAFLDRDGILVDHPTNTYKGYIYEPEHIAILPGTKEALCKMKEKGYLLLVASNQSTVADGYASPEKINDIHAYLNNQLDNVIDKFYICPHHPTPRIDVPEWAQRYRIECICRKPAPGLLYQGKEDFNIDFSQSWMIGDMISDIAAGATVGCRTIMIPSSHSNKIITTAKPFNSSIKPDFTVISLKEAAQLI